MYHSRMGNSIKAMIMSAGVGSRLEPLTKFVPKPLVPIANKPVMDILFDRLLSIGIKDVVCNTYYLAEKIISRYQNNSHGLNFNYIKEETLSGTAGGVKKCQFFFNEGDTFVVLSADGLSNADIKKGIKIHQQSGALATIGVKKIAMEEVPHFGVVVTDNNGFITEFQEKPSIEEAKSNLINTGIYIFDYKIFEYIPENTFYDFAKNVFPKLLLDHAINTFPVEEYWSDIGTIGQYIQSTKDLFEGKYSCEHAPIVKCKNGSYISNTQDIPNDTEFVGYSTIGRNVKIGKNVKIKNSIIWDNVTLGDNVCLTDCVIASNCSIQKSLTSQIIGANERVSENILEI